MEREAQFRIPPEEAEQLRKTLEFDREKWRRVAETPECKTQALMFKSWAAMASFGYAEVKNGHGFVWCPIHRQLEKIILECGLEVDKAVDALSKQIPEHAQKVAKVRKKIEAEMGE